MCHLIRDNYSTHKAPEVQAWLASWFNVVERFFTKITTKHLRRGAFTSAYYLDHTQCQPQIIRIESAEVILTKERA